MATLKTAADTTRVHLVESATKLLKGNARLTQEAREALVSGGTATARVTQLATEALASGTPVARVTQVASEVLVRRSLKVAADTANVHLVESASQTIAAGLVSQAAGDTANVHLVEAAVAATLLIPQTASDTANVHLAEAAALVGNMRLTQLATEALAAGSPNARLTQLATEVLAAGSPNARLTQAAVEVLVRHTPGLVFVVDTAAVTLAEAASALLPQTASDTANVHLAEAAAMSLRGGTSYVQGSVPAAIAGFVY